MEGATFLIRYADDFVIGFTRESDARRVQEVILKRFAKFGLTIHPDNAGFLRKVSEIRHFSSSFPTPSWRKAACTACGGKARERA